MPIRFRCAYCNQLLGISRRKAGQVVRCPTCAGQVLVPSPEVAQAKSPRTEPEQPLFERSDFDVMFEPVAENDRPLVFPSATQPAAPPGNAAPAGAWGTHAEPALDVERFPVPPPESAAGGEKARPPGLWLSPTLATLLSVAAIVALALAFGAGLLIGYVLRPAPQETGSVPALSSASAPGGAAGAARGR
jgi:DNA-directed RNA polymerase subunit RPC12/RpoP